MPSDAKFLLARFIVWRVDGVRGAIDACASRVCVSCFVALSTGQEGCSSLPLDRTNANFSKPKGKDERCIGRLQRVLTW